MTQDGQTTIVVEYIWIGGNEELRSKARVLTVPSNLVGSVNLSMVPVWNYDGSSTVQAEGRDSEVIVKPVRICRCPFRKGHNLLVLCDAYNPTGLPITTNTRYNANIIFNKKPEEKPWFGIEQEFFMIDAKTDRPLGFNNEVRENPVQQGQYYCSIGAGNAFGRDVIEEALSNMLFAELKVSGINAEVAPGQWEYQIGPVEGIDAADQMWLSRYILERTAEKYNVKIDYHPKPLGKDADWNGSGCHTNFSTQRMREDGGIDVIIEAVKKLEQKHSEHMTVYGKFNDMRMSGKHETASFDKFTYGKANRGASVRIGNAVYAEGKGYFEDRRPASNADPYLVTSKIFETTCL
ncbi:glutamine synthetase [Yasminevirus sp. GU-2018]|uniref:glutamine synthetase n=1 Tax=Yasminevirus sp. GU-2018 TaxID=2420051 RepID=A0A5K0U7U5_9VIRU|nr:glutamine synthetase [Yasminevirus sp. GU-2018]